MSTALDWHGRRSFHHSAFPPERIAAERSDGVSVCLPAREEAETIGRTVEVLMGMKERGAIDEVVVVDAASAAGTAAVRRDPGARRGASPRGGNSWAGCLSSGFPGPGSPG